MKKNRKMRILVIMTLSLFILSCKKPNNTEIDKSKIAKSIIENYFNDLKEDKRNFLVNPYYKTFGFIDEVQDNETNREKVLELRRMDNVDFDLLKEDINKKFKGVFSEDLFNLSDYDKASYVFSFSGFTKGMVFVDVFRFGIEQNKESLKNKTINFLKKPIKGAEYSFVVLIKDNSIEEMFLNSFVAYGL